MDDTPAAGVSFGRRLADLVAEDAEVVALVVVGGDGSEESLTRRDLDLASNRWCRALQAKGVGRGDRVALMVPNSVDLVLAVLGAWKAGAVPVPVRYDLPDWERDRVLAVVDAAIVLDVENLDTIGELASRMVAGGVPDEVGPQLHGICSSGSTGTPKVIMNEQPGMWLPHLSEPFLNAWAPVDRPQTILVPAPMYHTNGFNPLFFLFGRDRLVVLEKFDASAAVDAIERHRVTNFTATPTMLQRIARLPGIEGRDLSSVRWILQGAAVMPPALLRTWFALLSPEQVVMAYGMTEALGLTSLRGDEWLARPGSVGRGFRGTQIRILDEHGADVPTGELGEIHLRSPMTGTYSYRGGAPLLPSTADGFSSAGDLGRLDEDGYLYLVDRRVDMVVSGGANVFPAEVESALSEHPDIADVVVLGLKDEEWGRRVHAVVQAVGPLTAADVIAFAKARLAAYKAPKTVEFVDEIPRAASTKVSRMSMREERGG